MAMPSKAERIHQIVYSCDSRTELAERIAGLEELVADVVWWLSPCSRCEKCPARDACEWSDECLFVDWATQRARKFGIEVGA